MQIASWNVNSLNVRLPHLQDWLQQRAPDVVGLQETKLEDGRFPVDALAGLGYRCVFSGQKTYNGVALLSREAATDVQIGIPGLEDEQRRVIAGTFGDVRVVNLYVVNGQAVGSEKYAYKLRWLDALHTWLQAERARWPNLVVMGDFNIAPEGRDTHDPLIWNDDSILTSVAERDALRRLLALGLGDSYRWFSEAEGEFSWWDYRAAGFRRNLGLRIDLLLASDALRTRAVRSWIDREPRTWERPSDHAPVLLELA